MRKHLFNEISWFKSGIFYPDEERTPESNSDEDDDDDSDEPMTEMRFAPDNTNNLDAMFQAMSQCQSLHRDPHDSCSDGKFLIEIINMNHFYINN